MFDMLQFDMQSVINQLLVKILEGKLSGLSSGEQETTGTQVVDGEFASIINQVAEKYDVDPTLVQSVIKAESNFNAEAISSAGAMGLMQLMPATAASLGVTDPLDPYQNIEGGVQYLRKMLDRYDGNVQLALAAYNAGPGTVDKYGGIPPYQETQTYVDRVLDNWNSSTSDWKI